MGSLLQQVNMIRALLICSLATAIVHSLPKPLPQGGLFAWLNQIHYIPPPARQGTCRDCSRSEARFGFDLTPTQPPLACCPVDPPSTPTCTCGKEGGNRIVGGEEVATPGKYPWIAAIRFENSAPGRCAATLIASRWAVTAAHCSIAGEKIVSIVLGEHDISTAASPEDNNRKEVRVEKVINHESFGAPLANSNDIALLYLAEEVDLNVHTPACLPELNKDFTGQTGAIYGWGTTNSCRSTIEDTLREASVTIVSDAVCKQASGTFEALNPLGFCITQSASYADIISEDDMLCAGGEGQDSCQGDSGGPFTVKVGDQHNLVGVVSFGAGCGAQGLYGVYSEVSRLRTWLEENMKMNGGATYCPSTTSRSLPGLIIE